MSGYRQCYCGGHYRCEECRRDVCFCACKTDGAPHSREAVTSGYVNPTQARLDAWAKKQEARA